MSNEMQANQNNVVSEDNQYTVKIDENGKYKREANYFNYSSVKPQTKEEKIWLFNLLEGDSDSVFGMKENIGQEFFIHDIITNSYDSIDEETGEITHGVLTYLLDGDKNAYVTSSKSVYFTLNRITQLFGKPDDEDYEPVEVKITSEKGKNGNIIKLKMIG